MALSPSEIVKTLDTARDLNAQRQSMQAFILAWTAWEGYNFRLVLAALQMQGLTQARAKDVLSQLRSHDTKNMKRIRSRVFVEHPSNLSGAGTYWRAIETDQHHRSFRARRNGLVHGSASADPRILSRGVTLIDEAVSNEILSELSVRIRFGEKGTTTTKVGPILGPRQTSRGSRPGTATMKEVVEWLDK